jgi:hypothetical protein
MTTALNGYPETVPDVPVPRHTMTADERKDFTIDYTQFLATGDVIVGSSWASDTGLMLTSPTYTTTSATVFVSGGSANYAYRLFNTATTAGGRVVTRRIWIRITGSLAPAYPLGAASGSLGGAGSLTDR